MNFAHSLALDSNDAWERLTKQYEKVEPLALLPILTMLVEDQLNETGAQHYRNPAQRLKKMRQLTADSKAADVDHLIAELRESTAADHGSNKSSIARAFLIDFSLQETL